MKRKRLLAILCVIVILGALFYAALLYHDYTLLRDSGICAEGSIGIAGDIPPQVNAYKRLNTSPFAIPIFRLLEKNGTAEGKLYALMSLKRLDRKYFDALASSYQNNYEHASYMIGCSIILVNLRDHFN